MTSVAPIDRRPIGLCTLGSTATKCAAPSTTQVSPATTTVTARSTSDTASGVGTTKVSHLRKCPWTGEFGNSTSRTPAASTAAAAGNPGASVNIDPTPNSLIGRRQRNAAARASATSIGTRQFKITCAPAPRGSTRYATRPGDVGAPIQPLGGDHSATRISRFVSSAAPTLVTHNCCSCSIDAASTRHWLARARIRTPGMPTNSTLEGR